MDLVESGAIKGNDGLSLYNDMCDIFLQVTSPFTAYQKNLPQLEAAYLGEQTSTVAKQIQQAVTAVSASNLESLQLATETLQDLSTFAFPLCEGAVARFELLNGGYGPANALSVMGHVLSGHAGELAMAVKTLSAAMMADETELLKNFDEPHVLHALEVLKIAGSFRRSLVALENKTRERLVLLTERMEAHQAREKIVKEISSKGSSTSGKFFALPDSLSAVEIDSLVTKAICGADAEDGLSSSHVVLKRLTSLDPANGSLFAEVNEATNSLISCCHTFVFDVCSAVPRLQLAGMRSMVIWQTSAKADGLAYGTLPQQYITQIGEHMLALVQALEPFASDKEALALANEVMGGVRDIAVFPWSEFVNASGASAQSDSGLVKALMEGKQLIGFVRGNPPLDEGDTEETEGNEQEDEAARASAVFCDAWLDIVGLSITGRLLECIMLIPSLSPKGCEHLCVDLNYLVNVFSALGIAGHPHPLLAHVAEIAAMDGASLTAQISSRDRSNPIGSFLATMESRLATIRGIPYSTA